MDKSAAYIRMCAAAHDLQRAWGRSHGDVVTQDMKTTSCWLPATHPCDQVRRGYRIRRASDVVHIARCVWLPRLDQLMELAHRPHAAFDQTTQAFFSFCDLEYGGGPPPKKRFASLEQMWLAFVMQRRFHRRWEDSAGWTPIGSLPPDDCC